MATIRRANGRKIGLAAALDSEDDVVAEHLQFMGEVAFKYDLWKRASELERLVARHLGLDASRVKTGHPKTWRSGSFNVAIPMLLNFEGDGDAPEQVGDDIHRVILRCPIPTSCAETHYPGSILEKMRCEVATYIWMQRHCPDIRIPRLYGFGLPNGRQFSHASQQSFFRRFILRLRQCAAFIFRRPIPSAYLPFSTGDTPIETGYMVIEYLGPSMGQQLPLVIQRQPLINEPAKIRNLFRGVSRIILGLARIPQPRIGSFRFNEADSTISLDNRPLTMDMLRYENQGAPRTIHVDKTYTDTRDFVSDLLTMHDQRFLAASHAAHDEADCKTQMAMRVFLRGIAQDFTGPRLDVQPQSDGFRLWMSDQNATNLIVDDDWNVTGLFDLEGIVSAPLDMPHVPRWLTWKAVDEIAGERFGSYEHMHHAFMEVFREEEARVDAKARISSSLDASWISKQVWFYRALMSSHALDQIADAQLVPLYYPNANDFSVSALFPTWCANPDEADRIVATKVTDRRAYENRIRALFAGAAETNSN